MLTEFHDLSLMACMDDTNLFISLQETQLNRETAQVSEENQASTLATSENKESADTLEKENKAAEVPQDAVLQKSTSQGRGAQNSVSKNTVQANEEEIDSGKNTAPEAEQPNKELSQTEPNHERDHTEPDLENCSRHNGLDQKETAVSTDEAEQQITPEIAPNEDNYTESCETEKEETVKIANGNLETPIESNTAESPSHKADPIAAPLEDKSVQTPNVDPNTNKKMKKKEKSTAEEKKLGDYEYMCFSFSNTMTNV